MFTRNSMAETSVNIPTVVAKAAGEVVPKSAITTVWGEVP